MRSDDMAPRYTMPIASLARLPRSVSGPRRRFFVLRDDVGLGALDRDDRARDHVAAGGLEIHRLADLRQARGRVHRAALEEADRAGHREALGKMLEQPLAALAVAHTDARVLADVVLCVTR